ncbi:hypothetical protein M8C21_006703 [Ambrosia artemisiifolia]|uniref:Protein IQ-DOMAIN 1 n=1 Tax=Ambrosia artemisiifolia TaxID=4212 RepID=A0AAD5CPI4_AMBAR|nr:hypothetical protein M8C21_006703 [Ambrosia artemisiifolia]
MGKKSWFSAMKKALSPSTSKSKTKKEKRSNKSKSNPKNSCHVSLDACSSQTEAALANPSHHYHSTKETVFIASENEQIKHVDSITYTTTVAQDAVSHAAAAKVNRTRSNSRFLGRTREEVGAIKIQAAYRGYMATRAFRSLRAMRRLNMWLQGQAVKRQTTFALMRIQTMGRVQSQVRVRRIRMAEVNEALQRQLIQRRLKILEKQAFDLSPRSKEQVEASLRSKKEAAERRLKALAYAYSRQQMWRNAQSPKSGVVDPNHFDWGWSWSNRWDVIGPRETETTSNVGPMIRQQSLPSKPLVLPKSSRAQILKAELSRINTGCLAGIANKRHLVTSSSFSGAPRIAVR